MTEKLWGGRFEASLDEATENFGASIKFEQRLAYFDLQGSLAHAKMLGATGIVTDKEAQIISDGLKSLQQRLLEGRIEFKTENEDIHMNMERYLREEIGPVAGKLHTARSRNDQVATDMHLYLKSVVHQGLEKLKKLRTTLVNLSVNHVDTILPGYTHLQRAQPICLGQHFMAYYQMFTRDYERFEFNLNHIDINPLGAAALAGTTFPIDRKLTTQLLGFSKAYDNAMDAVSDRDFILEFLSNASMLMMHLSRFCEEIILWCSQEFQFITLSDQYSTGSSIMPQKKNPDMAELIRGKTGRVYGNLLGLLTVMKGLPLAYNKDLQEDKEGMFDTADTLLMVLSVMDGMLSTMTVNVDNMEKATHQDFSNATELADYLSTKGMPFREAHAIVGQMVLHCLKEGKYLQDVSLEQYKAMSPLIEKDVYEVLDPKVAIARRTSLGVTAFESVRAQIKQAKSELRR